MSDTQLRRFLAPRLLVFFCPTRVTAGAIPRMPCSTSEMPVNVSEVCEGLLLGVSQPSPVRAASRGSQPASVLACIYPYIIRLSLYYLRSRREQRKHGRTHNHK